MPEPCLALQTAIRSRLIAAPDVLVHVPADCIFDRSGRPEAETCIIIGDGLTVFADKSRTFFDRAYATINIWKQTNSVQHVQVIAGTVRDALPSCPWLIGGYAAPYVTVTSGRYLRDPENVYCRGILTVEALMQRRAAA